MQNNSIVEGSNNQEWINSKDMAKALGVSASTFSIFLTNNPDVKEKYCKKIGRSLMASKAMIPEYVVLKGLRHASIQFSKSYLKDAKMGMVNMAQKAHKHELDGKFLLDKIVRLEALVEKLVTKQIDQERSQPLNLLPEPTKDVPEMNLRASLNKYIREQSIKQNRYINILWNELYSQFYSRYGINITLRAKRKEMTIIEYAEEYNHLEDLYALARKIYK